MRKGDKAFARILLILIVFVIIVIGIWFIADALWCMENYPLGEMHRCLWYENTTWGRLVQP